MKTLNVTREDCIRMAAFIDGEGCIMISRGWRKTKSGKKNPVWIMEVSVVNTDPRLPKWCAEHFGGSLTLAKAEPKYKPSRPLFQWRASCVDAEMVLRACLEHFLIKREQAEIAIALRETLSRKYCRIGVPDAVNVQREEFATKLHLLKKPWDAGKSA
jgi:hypothetical protein